MNKKPKRLRLYLRLLLIALPGVIIPALLNVTADRLVWHVLLFCFWSILIAMLTGITVEYILDMLRLRKYSQEAHAIGFGAFLLISQWTFYHLAVPYLYS